MLIEKKEKEKKGSTTPVEGSPRHTTGATGHNVSPGRRTRRSPSPNCYRRRSPAARAPAEQEGAVGGATSVRDWSPTLEVQTPAGKTGSPASPRRHKHHESNDSSVHLSPRSGKPDHSSADGKGNSESTSVTSSQKHPIVYQILCNKIAL